MERVIVSIILVTLADLSSAFQGRPFSCQPPSSNRATRLYSFSQNDNNNNNDNDPNFNSVGDYVKQVHGGKYQFHDAGINSIGQEFAETGYASSAPKEDGGEEASLLAEIPRWANRMGTEGDLESSTNIKGVIDLQSSAGGPAVSVDIVNNELTWEPFYAKVVTIVATPAGGDQPSPRNFEDTQPLSVHPQAGTLAPRGGAMNLCDPQNPYSDSARICVQVQSSSTTTSGDMSVPQEPLFLLIGTEEEKWYYRIQL